MSRILEYCANDQQPFIGETICLSFLMNNIVYNSAVKIAQICYIRYNVELLKILRVDFRRCLLNLLTSPRNLHSQKNYEILFYVLFHRYVFIKIAYIQNRLLNTYSIYELKWPNRVFSTNLNIVKLRSIYKYLVFNFRSRKLIKLIFTMAWDRFFFIQFIEAMGCMSSELCN